MYRIILPVLAICTFCISVNAQPKPAKDTAIVKDTIVEEFQESVLDNIPVVSVDDNDASDASSQNVA